MDYGYFFSCSVTNIRCSKFNNPQIACLRSIIRDLKSAPSPAIEVEIVCQPLDVRCRWLPAHFCLNVLLILILKFLPFTWYLLLFYKQIQMWFNHWINLPPHFVTSYKNAVPTIAQPWFHKLELARKIISYLSSSIRS